jgi:hypothetical protein
VAAPNPLIIRDMPQMTKFVYDFYAKKVAALSEIARPAQSIGKLTWFIQFPYLSELDFCNSPVLNMYPVWW